MDEVLRHLIHLNWSQPLQLHRLPPAGGVVVPLLDSAEPVQPEPAEEPAATPHEASAALDTIQVPQPSAASGPMPAASEAPRKRSSLWPFSR
jgi:hypothetical protein